MNGFYVPGSVSSSYVANKRNEEGSLAYEAAETQVGIEKQAALQQLEKNYSSTIENAYASYLAANRGIEGSQMGQGYKELYKQLYQNQLASNIANANIQLNEQRVSLAEQEAAAKQNIENQFRTEVGYLDRVQQSFADYFEYAKGLTKSTDSNAYYLNEEQMKQNIDTMYDVLNEIDPVDYLDAEGNMGMRYADFVKSQLKTTEADQAWYEWWISGGLNEFMNAPKSVKQWTPGEEVYDVVEVGEKRNEDTGELEGYSYNTIDELYDMLGKQGIKYSTKDIVDTTTDKAAWGKQITQTDFDGIKSTGETGEYIDKLIADANAGKIKVGQFVQFNFGDVNTKRDYIYVYIGDGKFARTDMPGDLSNFRNVQGTLDKFYVPDGYEIKKQLQGGTIKTTETVRINKDYSYKPKEDTSSENRLNFISILAEEQNKKK